MGRVIEFSRDTDHGQLTTAVGDTEHITADQPWQERAPLRTDYGDPSEIHTEPEGWCWVCTLTWIVAGLFIGACVMFVGNLLIDLAKRMVP